ncbi:MAG: hypothetical protein MI919_27010 [Holophagales bacterium]|nr:hypothetical protein [Holophagales bacterium]
MSSPSSLPSPIHTCRARRAFRPAVPLPMYPMLFLALVACSDGGGPGDDEPATPSPSVAPTESADGDTGYDRPMPPTTFEAFVRAEGPLVIAHRGFSGKAPENTRIAVEQAIELGADMVEIDVTLTSDGHVIALHDETLDRTTDGTGLALERSLEEIRALDAGSWFGEEFAGEPVPTLDEVLEQVAGRILLNIEIKTEAVTDEPAGGIAQKVAELVRSRGLEPAVVVSSFDPRPLAHLRQLAPEIATASLYTKEIHEGKSPHEITAQVGSVMFNVGRRHLDAAMLADTRERRLPVAVYTVNEVEDFAGLAERGVHAVFTDRPDLVLRHLGRLP